MKKSSLSMLIASLALTSATAYAHELFVNAPAVSEGTTLQAEMGFGYFPEATVIVDDSAPLLNPLKLVGEQGESDMIVGEQNHQFSSSAPVVKGSYLVLASYKPTFFSKTPEGTLKQSKIGLEDALSCDIYTMYGKTVVNINGATDKNLISQPQGQRLEFIPLDNPSNIKVGSPFPIQLRLDGQPAANIKIEAEYAVADKVQPIEGVTDSQGIINFVPTTAGYWIVLANHKLPYENTAECDNSVIETSFSFTIAE